MLQAFELLQGFQTQQVYVPDAVLDNPNVAFYVAANAATAIHNPATNPNALDWLNVTRSLLPPQPNIPRARAKNPVLGLTLKQHPGRPGHLFSQFRAADARRGFLSLGGQSAARLPVRGPPSRSP